jgi:hypothetical protein
LSFFARGRSTAILGILALLFQAMLGAWHHHVLPFSSRGAPALFARASAGPETPSSAGRDCQICFGLSHHGTVPADRFAAAPPDQNPLPPIRAVAIATSRSSYLLFHSRAPPRA